ncbi:MAG TPA: glycosyltransferase family 4 protein [Candidatus Nanoarchaeia archaeon]|nr:glycosyltransferase family 4 protein [Candidatus Nanoarchaeia archaeon]
MRICIVSDYLPDYHPVWGGGEKATISIARLIAHKKEHEVFVLTKKPVRRVSENFKHYVITTTENFLGKKLGLYFTRFKSIWFPYDLFSYFSALKLFKKLRPDVINVHNFRELSFSVLKAAKQLGIPVIYSVFDYWFFCPKIDLVNDKGVCDGNCASCVSSERFGFLKSLLFSIRKKVFNGVSFDRVIALSDNSKSLMASHGLKKSDISVVHLPFSDLKASTSAKVNPNLILFLGWIHHRKGLLVLVKAVSKLVKKFPKIKLVAIGTPASKSYEEQVKSFISENKLEKNIDFIVGKKPLDEVKELIAKAGMIVIPEQWENMSPVLLIESMFNAKAIIASGVGGIPSFIKNGVSGLLVKPDSVADFSRGISLLLRSPKKAKSLGLNARKTALKLFDEDSVYKSLIQAYLIS